MFLDFGSRTNLMSSALSSLKSDKRFNFFSLINSANFSTSFDFWIPYGISVITICHLPLDKNSCSNLARILKLPFPRI